MKVAIPSNRPGGLSAGISPHFGRCELFTVVEIEKGDVRNVSVIENRETHFGFGAAPAEILVTSGVDAVMAQGMGPRALQLLGQSGIATYMTSAQTVGEAVHELVEDKAKLASLEDACKEARESTWSSPPIMPPVMPGVGRGMGGGMRRWMGPYPYGPSYPPMGPPMPYPPQQMPKPSPPPTGRFKVGVASQGPGGLDDMVSPIFGRCPNFTIAEVEGREIKDVKVMPNQLASAPSGVGIAAIQTLANEGVKFILAGRFGPNASMAASQFGIQMIMVPPGVRTRDAIDQFVIGSR